MAKFIDSVYTSGMRGKVGDKVFGRNRYGVFMRQAPVRTKPFTPQELNRQEAFALLSPIWSSLEDVDREQWIMKGRDKDIARMLGNVNIKAGWNLFHSVNLTMLSAGLPIIEKAPEFKHPQSLKEIDIKNRKDKQEERANTGNKAGNKRGYSINNIWNKSNLTRNNVN